MPSPRERVLREHLAACLSGVESLDDFKDWLIGATWNIDDTGDPAAIALTYEIKLALAEHSDGHLTEGDLRDELRPLVATRRGIRSVALAE